ncbi:MAG: hypothetical protein L7F77_03915 [Candidatus Magnetominusculus sp. LBB02]|nr:hypothetical protein [Candidatus Magnetominusculus sp. LBB02]
MFKSYIEDYILRDRSRTALFFVIAAAVFFIDKLTLGPFAPVQLHDVFETDLPRYKPMGELLFKHGLYFWYPNWPGGAPAYAWHHTPFYILNIAAQIMPLWVLYGAMVIVMMAVAGYGMYRFLCGYLQIDGWVAAVGGLFFALNMQLSSQFFLYTFSYAFPLYFAWAYDFHKGGGKVLKLIILNLLVALSYPVLTLPYFVILELLVIVLLQPQGQNARVRMLIRTAFVWFGYILICVPVIYGLYKYIPYSHRTYQYEAVAAIGILRTLHNGLSGHLLTTMTLIPLAGAMAIAGKVQRVRRGLIVAGVVVLLYAVFSSGVKMIFRGTLFEKMDLGHINTVFPMAMTMAAFIAIDAVIKDRRLLRRYLIGAAFGAGYSVLAVFIFKALETQAVNYFILNIVSGVVIALMIVTAEGNEELLLPKLANLPFISFIGSYALVGAIFYFSPRAFMKVDAVSVAPVMIITILVLALSCNKFFNVVESGKLTGLLIITLCVILFFQVRFVRFFGEESVPYISIMPDTSVLKSVKQENSGIPYRVASVDYTSIPNIQSLGFETPDARGPLFNKYYREFFKVVINPQLSAPGFLPYFNSNWYNLFISNFTSTTFFYPFSFFNIRYIIARGISAQTASMLDIVYIGNSLKEHHGIIGGIFKLYDKQISVVSFKSAFSRFYLVKDMKTLASDEAVYDMLVQTQGAGLVDTVYFSGTHAPSPLPYATDGGQFKDNKITLEYYSPDETVLSLDLATPAFVVASNNYDPHWKAYIDAQETAVFRADIAFQSIAVNNVGYHRVVFRYEDKNQRFTLIFIPIGMFVFNYFIISGGRVFIRP